MVSRFKADFLAMTLTFFLLSTLQGRQEFSLLRNGVLLLSCIGFKAADMDSSCASFSQQERQILNCGL
jgi:hypothetical protein